MAAGEARIDPVGSLSVPAGPDERAIVRPSTHGAGRWLATGSAYWQLTKPRIVLLLLITTVPAMVLADRGVPSLWLIAATLIGGTAAAGGANAINQFVDRDIDHVMRRTRRRPLPSKAIEPGSALAFGLLLGASGFVWLAVLVNVLAALLALAALAFYVLVYTIWLKRSSTQNIVIGGAAGAAPVLVGWAAVTGRVGLPAVVMFVIVFLWTPPHFWALAIRYERDYAAAGVPMLPVVVGTAATARQILWYSLFLVAATLALYPVAHLGPIYLTASVVLGAGFVARAVRLLREGTGKAAMEMFKYSIGYLALVFGAVGADVIVRHGL
jgi:protoheme IX farnesyltransferase